MPGTKVKEVTIENCDEKIAGAWKRLKDDPKADAAECRTEINIWLDARLILMRQRKTK